MKKLIAFACAAALALVCIAGCSSSKAADSQYAGEWQASSVQVGNVSADISSVFSSFSLKLNSDSTYNFTYELADGSKTVSTEGSPWESSSSGVTFGSGEDKVELTTNGDYLVLNVTDNIKVNLAKK